MHAGGLPTSRAFSRGGRSVRRIGLPITSAQQRRRGRDDMRGWLAGGIAALLLALPMSAQAQKPETTKVRLAVGGKSSLYYLPLSITERLRHFKETRLRLRSSNFSGGAKSPPA